MRIGTLRHRVEIQEAVESRTTSGAVTKAWSTKDTVWASVRPVNAREAAQAKQAYGTITHAVTLRYTDDLTTADRLVFGDRVLNILGVINPEERNITLELLCLEAA